ncbi:MAG: hypothetical protein AB4352_16505 [Hormoscilla sp.]
MISKKLQPDLDCFYTRSRITIETGFGSPIGEDRKILTQLPVDRPIAIGSRSPGN